MKKKLTSIISVILCMVSLLSLIPVTASAATEGAFKYSTSNGKATITGLISPSTYDIVLPSTIGGAPVVAVGKVSMPSYITSIIIPSSVEVIEEMAFSFCSKIKTVTVRGANLKKIEKSAFNYCDVLEKINIPKSVETIDEEAFLACVALKEITLPASLKKLGSGALSRCESLKSVALPSSIDTIYKKTFYSCKSLEEITIPASITKIEESAFSYCSNLKTVYYTGTEAQWKNISIAKYNDLLKNANIIYNYIAPEKTTFEDSDTAIVSDNLLLVKTGSNINEILSYAPSNSVIKAADGSATTSKKPATGMKLILNNKTTYTIIVKGDIDGNGSIAAKDARLALRASANLEKLNNSQKKAADANNDGKLSAADARLLLRASANLEKVSEFPGLGGSDVPTTQKDTSSSSIKYLSAKDYTYLAGSDFRSIRRKYSTAQANGAYVIAFTDLNGDKCVLTYVRYKIIENHYQTTLHNITQNKTYSNFENHYDLLASSSYGSTKIKYMNLKVEAMSVETAAMKAYSEILKSGKNTGKGEFVNAATLNL